MNKNYALKRVFELLVILSLCSGCRGGSSQVTPVVDKTQPKPPSSPNSDQPKLVDIPEPAPFVAPSISSKENKEKETQNPQEVNDDIPRDEHLNLTNQLSAEALSLFSLDLPLFQRVGEFLPPNDVLQLAQASKYCLKSVSSHLNLELSLVNKILTEEDFINRFGEDGFYKEAQCLDLSRSSFHPAWLKHLPKTLKALKLNLINTKHFSELGFSDKSEMIIEIVKALGGGTVPQLKFLDISNNALGAPEAAAIAKNLTFLRSLYIYWNRIGPEGTRHIAENLKSLISLDIRGNNIGSEGAQYIAENLKSLTSLDISENQIGDEGARYIAEHLKSLTTLDIRYNKIGDEGARYIAEHLKSLTILDIGDNKIGPKGARYLAQLPTLKSLSIENNLIAEAVIQELREQLPRCHIHCW